MSGTVQVPSADTATTAQTPATMAENPDDQQPVDSDLTMTRQEEPALNVPPSPSNVVYGDRMTQAQLDWLRNLHIYFVSICTLGTVLQVLQVFVTPVGWASTAVYWVVNISAIVVARMLLITLKFEHKQALIYGIRVTAMLVIYTISIVLTLSSMGNDTMLTLMAVGGIVNVIILIPAGINEMWLLYKTRSDNVGVTHATPLTLSQNVVLLVVLVGSTLVMAGIAICSLLILALNKTESDGVWWANLVFYTCLNMTVLVMPTVMHWIETDVQIWPILSFLWQNVLELTCALLLAAALFILDDKDMHRWFGIIGVTNGLLGASAIFFKFVHIYYAPRTVAGDALKEEDTFKEGVSKDLEEGRSHSTFSQ